MQVALGAPVVFDLCVPRVGVGADIESFWASGVEGAPGRQVDESGRHAGDSDEVSFFGESRQAVYEQLSVWVLWVFEDLTDGSDFDEFTGVHDSNGVGELCDESHVVSDEYHGGIKSGLDSAERLHYLALYDDI